VQELNQGKRYELHENIEQLNQPNQPALTLNYKISKLNVSFSFLISHAEAHVQTAKNFKMKSRRPCHTWACSALDHARKLKVSSHGEDDATERQNSESASVVCPLTR